MISQTKWDILLKGADHLIVKCLNVYSYHIFVKSDIEARKHSLIILRKLIFFHDVCILYIMMYVFYTYIYSSRITSRRKISMRCELSME